MKKIMAILLSSVLLLTALSISVSAARQTYFEDGHIIGVVEDHSGNPLEGVMVIAWGDEIDQTVTDEDGEFDLSVKAGNYLVRFRASGYIGNFVWVNDLEPGEIRDLGIIRLLKIPDGVQSRSQQSPLSK